MRLVTLVLAAILVVLPQTVSAETKALIIASNYEIADNPAIELANPLADAILLEAALRRTSVNDVTVLREPTAEDWEAGLEAFVAGLEPDDIALFYYAGHGFQVGGVNYFLTADGESLISLDLIMQRLTSAARGAVVIVDACRSNPFAMADDMEEFRAVEVTGSTRQLVALSVDDLADAASGLAQLGNLRGLSAVVLFSTEPGNVAEDGDTPGLGSPFARAFSEQITRRQSLDEAMRRTAVEVNMATDGRQSPWRQGDLPFNVFIAGMRALPIP